MRLIAYRTGEQPPLLRPAPPRREWMEATPDRFAYRCLPLTIGNQFGWEMLSPCAFEALWTGGRGVGAIEIVRLGGCGRLPESHFGNGILTMHPCHLFRTESPHQLLVTGPFNAPKDGIQPLTGIVETDWLPFTFSMNWIFTRPGIPIRFEEGEPFCHFFPVTAEVLESVEPEVRELSDAPELERQFVEWRTARDQWNADLATPGTAAHAQGWQRFYHQGTTHRGEAAATRHQTRLHLLPFREAYTRSPGELAPSEAAHG